MLLGILAALGASAAEPRLYLHPAEVDVQVESPAPASDWSVRCWVDAKLEGGAVTSVDVGEACGGMTRALEAAVQGGTFTLSAGTPDGWVHMYGPRHGESGLRPAMVFGLEDAWKATKQTKLAADAAGRRCVVRFLPGSTSEDKVIPVLAVDTNDCPGRMGESVRMLASKLSIRRGRVGTRYWEQRVVLHEVGDYTVGRKARGALVIEDEPRPVRRVAPVYPLAMKGVQEGQVTCNFVVSIDTNGAPTSVRPSNDAGQDCAEPFQIAGQQSLRRWRFMPAVVDGAVVATDVPMQLTFDYLRS